MSIVDGTKQVYDASKNAQGLPEAFREVAGRLPIVRNILDSTQQYIKHEDINEDSCRGVENIVAACKEKAQKLDDLFHKVIPADGASDLKRYYTAVKACGRGDKVENLMKGMLEDVQLLACERGMKTATKAQEEQLVKAITGMSAVPTSVPEYVFQQTGSAYNSYGTGSTQYNAQGECIAQGNARQYNTSGGPMYFGRD